jgi:hypothetical protein
MTPYKHLAAHLERLGVAMTVGTSTVYAAPQKKRGKGGRGKGCGYTFS